jgi:hypothetical protein
MKKFLGGVYMKKLVLFITALTVALNISGRVLADGTAETLKDQAGITPDNVILYPIDKAIDNIKINIASEDIKPEVLTEVAEERLGEGEVMVDKGKTELSTEPLNDYNNKMDEAVQKVEDSIEKIPEDSVENKDKLDKLKVLEDKITAKQEKSIEVLQNIQSKVSDNAKETIAKVIEMQTAKKEAIIAVAKERQVLIENKQAVKEAEKKLEEVKKSGNEQDIKTAEEALTQKQQSLASEKEKLAQVVSDKKEVMKGGVGELKKQLKEEVKNGTITKKEAKAAVKAAGDNKVKTEDREDSERKKESTENKSKENTTSTTTVVNDGSSANVANDSTTTSTVTNKTSIDKEDNDGQHEKEEIENYNKKENKKEKNVEKVKENKKHSKEDN